MAIMTVCIECSLHRLNHIHKLLETPINKILLPTSYSNEYEYSGLCIEIKFREV